MASVVLAGENLNNPTDQCLQAGIFGQNLAFLDDTDLEDCQEACNEMAYCLV